MSDLSHVEQLVDQWERNAVERAARYENMRQEVEQISITGSSVDGSVSVTVGHNGIPNDVRMTDGVSRMRPEQIAAAVLEAMRNAQSRYPAELARIMGETVGDDPGARHILAEAERNFPAADTAEDDSTGPGPQPGPPGQPGHLGPSGPQARQQPGQQRRPASPGGEDDFGDSSYLG
jgi:DNA-binding protein YbaB